MVPNLFLFVAAGCAALLATGCRERATAKASPSSDARAAKASGSKAAAEEPAGDALGDYFEPFPAADGFDFPVGDRDGTGSYVDRQTKKRHRGWYVATVFAESYSLGIHTGEDWNGRGGSNTDLGQPVHAVANGRVVFAAPCEQPWGGVIVIEHVVYDNHEKTRLHSQYAHLSRIEVKAGDLVERRKVIGAIGQDPDRTFPAHLHFELRTDTTIDPTYWPSSNDKDEAWVKAHYLPPTEFIRAHRTLWRPDLEETFLLVDHDTYRMGHFENGQLVRTYEVAFGQEKGRKRKRGDNRTPKGMYFVVNKHRGEFSGEYGAYYGGHWIKVNYPNAEDARWGLTNKLISRRQARRIARRWKAKKPTLAKTKLGSGIGFHGWAGPWDLADGGHLSWGCIVLHNPEIQELYDQIPIGAMVVIR